MNNYDFLSPRKRRQSLFIVEGNHEKNELIRLLLMCFPEIDIKEEDIIIYGTNIYMLYNEIVKEYQEDWDSIDVDLAYIVSRKKGYDVPLNKLDFNNIILIFDYERHDPNFSEDKICRLQKYFNNSTDVGKLFINYPMIESYQHFSGWPGEAFKETNISVKLEPGDRYKNLVKDTQIAKLVELRTKIDEILEERFEVGELLLRNTCVDKILNIHSNGNLEYQLNEVLSPVLTGGKLQTAKYQLVDILEKAEYCKHNLNYFEYMRKLFISIIRHNIYKARWIIGESYFINDESIYDFYNQMDLYEILEKENDYSRDSENGVIWVLNTSVFFVPDYNFSLIC